MLLMMSEGARPSGSPLAISRERSPVILDRRFRTGPADDSEHLRIRMTTAVGERQKIHHRSSEPDNHGSRHDILGYDGCAQDRSLR